jgi:hypothetical protein
MTLVGMGLSLAAMVVASVGVLRRGAGYRFVVIWEYVHDLG